MTDDIDCFQVKRIALYTHSVPPTTDGVATRYQVYLHSLLTKHKVRLFALEVSTPRVVSLYISPRDSRPNPALASASLVVMLLLLAAK